ncbi:MAG: DUF177 domain-containing protein [Bacteroidetes bacterium]|nr:DUF177 domain-containing protein [Bacteroidota bacterium]
MQGNYVIQLTKLSEGLNRLEFNIGNDFFKDLDYSKIKEVEGVVVAEIEKQDTTHKLWLQIQTKVRQSCDRCNELIYIPVSNRHELVVKQTDAEASYGDEDIIVLEKHRTDFDLMPIIYDFINVSLPLKVTCDIEGAEKKCDEELLSKLIKADNEEASEEIDPRWEKLKSLKNK